MKTFHKHREFLFSQKVVVVSLLTSLFVFWNKLIPATSKVKGDSLGSKTDSRVFLKTSRTFQAEEAQSSQSSDSSFFRKVFGGIGSFFALIGRGIGKGITSTLVFLGTAIAFPFTATYSLIARKNSNSGTETAVTDSRNG